MATTERGRYRCSVKETEGAFFVAAEPAADTIESVEGGQLAFDLAEGTSLTEAMRVADVMNRMITSISLT